MQLQLTPLASFIDHTLLAPQTMAIEVDRLCAEAVEFQFKAVCVNGLWVSRCAQNLHPTSVSVAAVVGFPLGACQTFIKTQESALAIEHGATEIDMVISLGLLKGKDFAAVEKDIREVVQAAAPYPVKLIIETGLLSFDEKILATQIGVAAGAKFIKTCTGFSPGAATVDDIALIRKIVGPHLGIKASGGVRSAQLARNLINAGATRIGTSSGVALVKNISSSGNY